MAKARPIRDRALALPEQPHRGAASWETIWASLREDYARELKPVLKSSQDWRIASADADIRVK